MDRKFGIVAVVSRDPTIDLPELSRRRILFMPRYIDRRSLFTFIASFRAAVAKYSRVRSMEGAGRFAPVFSLFLFLPWWAHS